MGLSLQPSFSNTDSMIDQNNKVKEVGAVCVETIAIIFPLKLHRILDDAVEKEYENIISWVPTNNGFIFKVHNPQLFASEIMPQYFNKTKYKSFQRQLNLWGFNRVTKGSNKGAYLHNCFIRGKPTLCHGMKRIKIKGIHSKTLLRSKKSKMSNTTISSKTTCSSSSSSNNSSSSSSSNSSTTKGVSMTKLWQAAVQKVTDLERRKEEIQKQLNTASRELMIPHVSVKSDDYLTNLLSTTTTTTNLNSNLNLQQKQEQEQINNSINKVIRRISLTLEEGDNTFFEGRNFFFVEESHVFELGCINNKNNGCINNKNKRSISRSFSIALEELDSDCDCDEHVLKELEEAIQLGTGMFSTMNTNVMTNTNTNTNTNTTSRSFSITLEELDIDYDCDEYDLKELEEAILLGTGMFSTTNTSTNINTNTNTNTNNTSTNYSITTATTQCRNKDDQKAPLHCMVKREAYNQSLLPLSNGLSNIPTLLNNLEMK